MPILKILNKNRKSRDISFRFEIEIKDIFFYLKFKSKRIALFILRKVKKNVDFFYLFGII